MFKLHSIITPIIMIAFLSQPAAAVDEYNSEEVAACVPVGKIAMKISKLQAQGLEQEFIEKALNEELREPLSLWVKPISALVFSKKKQASEKTIKEAIGYCLQTMKSHKKMNHTAYFEA
ncbi:MAG: hypothetical protein KAH20_17145 [Methylococcales bacterium]|nr:hypothetical protein [Methylococcales bacterium]